MDISVSSMSELEHREIGSMQQASMGAYAQAGASGTPQQTSAHLPPTHHHHRLPDTGPPTKLMRHDIDGGGGSGGGALSVVGQVGMPLPAPRPRGPKLKFTPEDDQLLIDLKENKSLTWKQIADFFPGRSSGTLQVRYCTKLKAKTTQWTDETRLRQDFWLLGQETPRSMQGTSIINPPMLVAECTIIKYSSVVYV
ncbi:myb DNA-binding domain containing protein [Grosmannia clavigera kw1407]|uniref:Myb DNA-binding domain containing protein n=1 Tax=Grosmannia clavigera (strain kw1407 / UAMH 11150) TaxID=655863 RepID=F0XR08_GROCL|nr:myb DNA-binding domain containing protein [Grosmannia clavigera kw1407]EFW99871.1 myb DNA-binding domain containing protein [Grosmannia clavigera kw1407]